MPESTGQEHSFSQTAQGFSVSLGRRLFGTLDVSPVPWYPARLMAGFFRCFPVAGDMALTDDGTDTVLWRGAAMVAQQIKDGALIWEGTAGWDPDKGLPMLSEILVKGPDFRVLRSVFRDFLLETPGVVSVDALDVTLNRQARALTVPFSVTCEDGATASDELSFTVV